MICHPTLLFFSQISNLSFNHLIHIFEVMVLNFELIICLFKNHITFFHLIYFWMEMIYLKLIIFIVSIHGCKFLDNIFHLLFLKLVFAFMRFWWNISLVDIGREKVIFRIILIWLYNGKTVIRYLDFNECSAMITLWPENTFLWLFLSPRWPLLSILEMNFIWWLHIYYDLSILLIFSFKHVGSSVLLFNLLT